MEEPKFTKMTDDEIPSWPTIEAALGKLEAILATAADSSAVAMAINQVPLAVAHFVQREVLGLKSVFRARQPRAGEDITNIKTFSYPSPEATTTEGRANRIGFPVFYGAIDADTAMKETLRIGRGTPENNVIYVGEWQPTAPLNIKQFLHPAHASANEVMDEYYYGLVGKLREMLKMYSPQNQVTLERLAGRMGNYFLRESDYRVSSTLAHTALYEFDAPQAFRIDAISYPSIVKEHKAINLAFSPKWVDSNLKLVELRKYQVQQLLNDGSTVTLDAVGRPEDGRIQWYEVVLDPHRIRRIGQRFEGIPDTELEYKQSMLSVNGAECDLNEVFKMAWSQERHSLPELICQTFSEGRIEPGTHRKVLTRTITLGGLSYEGKTIEALRLSTLVEYAIELQRMEG